MTRPNPGQPAGGPMVSAPLNQQGNRAPVAPGVRPGAAPGGPGPSGAGGLGGPGVGGPGAGMPQVAGMPQGQPLTPGAPTTDKSRKGDKSKAAKEAIAKPRKVRAPKKPPRVTSLQLKRIDPWTVLKISLIVSIVMFFVWMIAIGLLYLLFGSMDVFSTVNEAFANLFVSGDPEAPKGPLVTPSRVFGIAAIIGAVNIVLFTALSAVGAFIYNAAAGMAGGVEVTLGERD